MAEASRLFSFVINQSPCSTAFRERKSPLPSTTFSSFQIMGGILAIPISDKGRWLKLRSYIAGSASDVHLSRMELHADSSGKLNILFATSGLLPASMEPRTQSCISILGRTIIATNSRFVASAMKVPNMSNNHSEMFPRRKCFHGPLSNICFLSNIISQSHLNSSKNSYFGFSDPTEEAQDYDASKT
jgi:hypothetical protein